MADVVYFELPNGELVSNDPTFDPAEQRAKLLASVPNRGHEGLDPLEVALQTQSDAANLNPAALTGRDVQLDAVEKAKEAGLNPENPAFTEENEDGNQRVRAHREQGGFVAEPSLDNTSFAGTDYEEWPAAALAREVGRRGIVLPDRKKATAIKALRDSDGDEAPKKAIADDEDE